MLKILFPHKSTSVPYSLLILALRLLFGILFLKHGIDKWSNFELLQNTFPDPLGITSRSSLVLAIFGELICSAGFIVGFLYRLAIIPMITTMIIAFFVVHQADPFATRELAFIYLIVFVILLIAGPGKYSIDYLIGSSMNKRNNRSRLRSPRH